MRRTNATTLQDIAREAGVTAMTVSVVLNGSRSATRVSDTTRVRIQEVAARLRYRPNAVARGLSRRRMDTIGVVASIDGDDINLYFLEALNGILEAAARHGQNTTVFSIADWDRDQERILQFCDGRVDGMILIAPTQMTDSFADALLRLTPFVAIHGNNAGPNIDDLDVDDERGACEIVRYLIGLGHRRIAHFTGALDLIGTQKRLAGYRRAMDEAGLDVEESLIVPGHFTTESGRERMTRLLNDTRGPLPTAVFCANDAAASGSLEVMAQHGLRAPADISVVGFDDLLLSRMTTPPLTTVRQPFRRMGQYSVERLLFRIREAIERPIVPLPSEDSQGVQTAPSETSPESGESFTKAGDARAVPHTEIFPVEVVIRGSAGPPRPGERPPGPQ